MPTSQRHAGAGVIDRLLAAPQRFDFFQAVGLIERSRPDSLASIPPGLTSLSRILNVRHANAAVARNSSAS